MSEYPDFKIPIEDRHAAEFWWDEWATRFRETEDHAFKEQAVAMSHYIDSTWDDEENYE
jgi:hypothetical protein